MIIIKRKRNFAPENTDIKNVTVLLKNLTFDKSRYRPLLSSDKDIKVHKYNTIPKWSELKSNNTIKSKLDIQRLYSLQSGGNRDVKDAKVHFEARFSEYQNKLFNSFSKDSKILSVGCRWKGEIEFIRNNTSNC